MRGKFCAAYVGIGAYASWLALKFLAPFLTFAVREKLKGDHKTLLCRAGEECSLLAESFALTEEELQRHAVFSPDLSAEEVDRIHSLWAKRFHAKHQQHRGFAIIHVGPADLMDEDFAMYQRLAPLTEPGDRVVLVEPHPGQQQRLRDRIDSIHNLTSATILPVALCPTMGDGVTFYRISDAFFRDFKDYAFYMRYWASLDRQHLLDETQFFNSNQKVWLFKALGIFPESFPESADDWTPYIEELRVRCHTPASLLAEARLRPQDLDVLILDAEGYDTELMGLFLAMDGFAPATIMFEWHLHANDAIKLEALVSLVRALHLRGYDIHRHNHDVVAVARGA